MSDILLIIGAILAAIVIVVAWPPFFVYRVLFRSNIRAARHLPEEEQEGPVVSAPAVPNSEWRAVLGVAPNERRLHVIKRAYLRKARLLHPDRGGNNQSMAKLNEMYRNAKAELGD